MTEFEALTPLISKAVIANGKASHVEAREISAPIVSDTRPNKSFFDGLDFIHFDGISPTTSTTDGSSTTDSTVEPSAVRTGLPSAPALTIGDLASCLCVAATGTFGVPPAIRDVSSACDLVFSILSRLLAQISLADIEACRRACAQLLCFQPMEIPIQQMCQVLVPAL